VVGWHSEDNCGAFLLSGLRWREHARAATDPDNGTAPPSCLCVDLFRACHQFDFRRLSHSHRCAPRKKRRISGAVARVQTTKETYAKFGVYGGDPASGDDHHGANFGFWGQRRVGLHRRWLSNQGGFVRNAEPLQFRRLRSHGRFFQMWLKIRMGKIFSLAVAPTASTPARKDFTFSSSKCFSEPKSA